MTFDEAKAVAQKMGFQNISIVKGETSIDKFFTPDIIEKYKPTPYTGIYMQFRMDGTVYIGKTKDLRNRFIQHREAGIVMKYIAFRHYPIKDLQAEELRFIQAARHLGLPLTNLMANTRKQKGTTKRIYDEIVTPEDQDIFLETVANAKNWTGIWANLMRNTSPKFRDEWLRFCALPRYAELMNAASDYIYSCMPSPEETAGLFWHSTLLDCPSKRADVPVISIRAGINNVLEIYYFRRVPKQYYVRIALAQSVLWEAFKDANALCTVLPGAVIDIPETKPATDDPDDMLKAKPFYRTAIPFQSPSQVASELVRPITQVNLKSLASLTVPFDAFETVIAHPVIMTSASMAAIAAMRSQAPIFHNHNPLLAKRLLSKQFD